MKLKQNKNGFIKHFLLDVSVNWKTAIAMAAMIAPSIKYFLCAIPCAFVVLEYTIVIVFAINIVI